ncbi:MAG: GAF domain-containing protein [Chloroflexota bacterium]
MQSALILAFVAVALLPFAAISFIITISQAQSGQADTISQLQVVLGYKQIAIRDWSNTLKADLGNALLGQNMLEDITLILQTSPASPEYQEVRQVYTRVRTIFLNLLAQSSYYDQLLLLNQDGVVMLGSENTQEGQVYNTRTFFKEGMLRPYVDAPAYSIALGRTVMYASYPVHDANGQVVGLLVGRVRLQSLQYILADRNGLGQTGVTYLVGANRELLVGLNQADHGSLIQTVGVQEAFASPNRRSGSLGNYRNYASVPVIGAYIYLPDLQAAIIAEQNQQESARVTYAALAVIGSVAIASILLALYIAMMVTYNIAQPLTELTETASRIARGELPGQSDTAIDGPVVESNSYSFGEIEQRQDELGILANAFDNMTTQLVELINNLEQRVNERTQDLEIRSNYLEASAQVSRAAASILDLNELLSRAVELIREHFDLYYVGLFMIEESPGTPSAGVSETDAIRSRNRWAVLRAGTGEAGKAMLARRHRLPVGRSSMIGWSIANAQARIAQEASIDLVRVATSELPETRSEAAIPLRTRDKVLGALSVQSSRSNTFDEVSVSALQSLADQLAVAIENARLFAESQEALEAERRAYAQQTLASWQSYFASQPQFSYVSDVGGIERRAAVWRPEMQQAIAQQRSILADEIRAQAEVRDEMATLRSVTPASPVESGARVAIPIMVRGTVIGVLDIARFPTEQGWTNEEVNFLEDVCEQLGIALDSARLYAETRQLADQERALGEIAAQMRASLNVETVIKTAVEQIYNTLDLEQVVIQLSPSPRPSPELRLRSDSEFTRSEAPERNDDFVQRLRSGEEEFSQ